MPVLDRIAIDPVAFMRERLAFEPWSKQREIAEALRDYDRVSVKAANATGKSALAGGLVLWWLAGGPGSIVVTTASTEKQVKRVLWREVKARHKHARDLFAGATALDAEIYLAPDWFAVGLTADETEAFQGFHAARVLVIVDEASGVSEDIFEAIEGVTAGGESKVLLLGNPLRTSGTFFDSFGRDRDSWHTITVSAFDTPNLTGEVVSSEVSRRLVSRKWVERMARRRGEDSNEFRIRCLGQFPAQSDDGVVALDDMVRAQEQSLLPGLPLLLVADIARFGSDETVLGVRRGNHFRVERTYQGRDLMATCGEIMALAKRLRTDLDRAPILVIDDAGLGGGLVDRLRELSEFRVIPYLGARSAKKPNDYPNARSEDWFGLAEVLALIDLDPADQELAADLLAPRYSLDSQGRRVVESKDNTRKRLRRSPDRGDTAVMAFSVDRPVAPGRERRRKQPTISSPARYRISGIDRLGHSAGNSRESLDDVIGRINSGANDLVAGRFGTYRGSR